MATTPITTHDVAKAHAPDTIAFAPSDVIPDAAILQHSTVAADIQGDEPQLRVGYAGNATAKVVAEGAEIDETAVAMDEILINTVKVATVLRYSNELGRQGRTPDELALAMARAVTDKADALFLAQAAPTAPAISPVAGLLNQTGVVAKTAVATNLDKLIDLLSEVQTNGAVPTVWVVAPDTLATLSKLKTTADSNLNILGAGVEAGERRLLGLPVVVNRQLTSKSGLLIDPTAVISAVGPLFVDTSKDAAFTADSMLARVTFRLGFGLPRPNRVGTFKVS